MSCRNLLMRSLLIPVIATILTSTVSASEPPAPVVTLNITTPDRQTHELRVPESGLATVTLKDGTEYGFRPTIQDSSPWNRIVLTIFKSATTTAPTTVLGELELRKGGSAVDSKTRPAFKVSVPGVSAPTEN